MSKSVAVLLSFINILGSIQNSDITTFGVKYPLISSEYGVRGSGCGINYETNTLYIIGGVMDFNDFTNNPYYITWNGLNTTDWINITDYSSITTPVFDTTLVNTDMLLQLPGVENGKWYCDRHGCSTQINKTPYIYIVSNVWFSNSNQGLRSPYMIIFDMNVNDYVSPTKYKYVKPGGAVEGIIFTIYRQINISN